MKHIINITEKDLRKIVRESILNTINEGVMSKKELSDTIFVSYGTKSFDEENFKTPHFNHLINKPRGGFWGSPIYSKFGWADFCSREDFNVKSLAESVLFKVKSDAKIYVIDTKEDYRNIITTISDGGYRQEVIDFYKLSKNYDGIFVTSNAVSKLRFVPNGQGLYTWDVESICIFNPNVIEVVDDEFLRISLLSHENETSDSLWGDEDSNPLLDKDRKFLQMNKDYELYGNRNLENDSRLFKTHPAILAQKHGNSKDAKLAKKYNGTAKSGL